MAELRPVDADYLLRVLPLDEGLRARLEEFRLGRAPLYNADRAELRELVVTDSPRSASTLMTARLQRANGLKS
jgi:hypothetical protein